MSFGKTSHRLRSAKTILPKAIDNSNLDEYVGLWEYLDENLWLRIHEDATWEFVNDQDEVIESGTLWADETGVTLHLMAVEMCFNLTVQ